MKLLKISLLILVPVLLAAMFGNTLYNIADHSHMLEPGLNYIPLFWAFSFFAFWAFFVPTANLLFPSDIVSTEQKGVSPVPYLQPCVMQVVRTVDYNNALFNSLNIG